MVAVVVLALNSESESWAHLTQTVLPLWTLNTALLALGVAGGVLLLGVPPAWLVTRYRFPLRGLLEVTLVLPLAVPPYIAALALSWLLDGAGAHTKRSTPHLSTARRSLAAATLAWRSCVLAVARALSVCLSARPQSLSWARTQHA